MSRSCPNHAAARRANAVAATRARAQRMQREATHDAATGLPNRDECMSRLERTLAAAGRTGGATALLCVVEALRATQLLDSEPDELFDRIVRIVCTTMNVPVSVVSLVDSDRQWFKARCGTDARATARNLSFSAWTVLDDCPLDARFTVDVPPEEDA